MNRSYIGLCAITLWVAMLTMACTAGISEQAQSQVTYMGAFAQLQQQPEKYANETVMWGGKIVQTQPGETTTELVVLQLDLAGQDRPQDNDNSQGRFLARTTQFIDPALFPPGTLITVVGRVQGAEKRLIGQMAYQYPVIGIVELKKWPASTGDSPRFHFGIGVGTHF
jgi:outer membrane lipoprotein